MAKLHMYNPGTPLPPMDARLHDYDPAWDYLPVAPPHGAEFARAIQDIEDTLLPSMGFLDAVVFFVEEDSLGDDVGIYVDGTHTCPMIGIDLAKLRAAAAGDASDLEEQLHITVAHELAHAYLDGSGAEVFPSDDEAEAVVEAFGRVWMTDRDVAIPMLDTFLRGRRTAPASI